MPLPSTLRGLATLAVFLALPGAALAQPCPGSVRLERQAQVDAFACDTVHGDLAIAGTVTNLRGLAKLTSVHGDLFIGGTRALRSLEGLGALAAVDGTLWIERNPHLASFAGLGGLESIGGSLVVFQNAALQSLDGLDALTGVRNVYLTANPVLAECARGLAGLVSGTPATFSGVRSRSVGTGDATGRCASPEAILEAVAALAPTLAPDALAARVTPATTGLGTAYPNPSAGRATVPYTLAEAGAVRLAVLDVLGREVAVLADGPMAAGTYTAILDGTRLGAGTYLVRLTAPDGPVDTLRLTLTR